MRLLIRLMQRVLVAALGVFSVWLIAFVIFDFADQRLPWVVALGVTYGVGAYVVLPRVVRMGLKILQRKRVPRFTTTGDGLPGDPVNNPIWEELNRRKIRKISARCCAWRMARAFVFDRPYPSAPFSTLYLFGRGQDIGFQKAIDNSPRKRHHIRFWALSLAHAEDAMGTAAFWMNADRPDEAERVHWVGAGTRDTGFSLTKLTFQITHATDADTNAERDFIVGALAADGLIGAVSSYRAGEVLPARHVNRYITDGDVSVADLVDGVAGA